MLFGDLSSSEELRQGENASLREENERLYCRYKLIGAKFALIGRRVSARLISCEAATCLGCCCESRSCQTLKGCQ